MPPKAKLLGGEKEKKESESDREKREAVEEKKAVRAAKTNEIKADREKILKSRMEKEAKEMNGGFDNLPELDKFGLFLKIASSHSSEDWGFVIEEDGSIGEGVIDTSEETMFNQRDVFDYTNRLDALRNLKENNENKSAAVVAGLENQIHGLEMALLLREKNVLSAHTSNFCNSRINPIVAHASLEHIRKMEDVSNLCVGKKDIFNFMRNLDTIASMCFKDGQETKDLAVEAKRNNEIARCLFMGVVTSTSCINDAYFRGQGEEKNKKLSIFRTLALSFSRKYGAVSELGGAKFLLQTAIENFSAVHTLVLHLDMVTATIKNTIVLFREIMDNKAEDMIDSILGKERTNSNEVEEIRKYLDAVKLSAMDKEDVKSGFDAAFDERLTETTRGEYLKYALQKINKPEVRSYRLMQTLNNDLSEVEKSLFTDQLTILNAPDLKSRSEARQNHMLALMGEVNELISSSDIEGSENWKTRTETALEKIGTVITGATEEFKGTFLMVATSLDGCHLVLRKFFDALEVNRDADFKHAGVFSEVFKGYNNLQVMTKEIVACVRNIMEAEDAVAASTAAEAMKEQVIKSYVANGSISNQGKATAVWLAYNSKMDELKLVHRARGNKVGDIANVLKQERVTEDAKKATPVAFQPFNLKITHAYAPLLSAALALKTFAAERMMDNPVHENLKQYHPYIKLFWEKEWNNLQHIQPKNKGRALYLLSKRLLVYHDLVVRFTEKAICGHHPIHWLTAVPADFFNQAKPKTERRADLEVYGGFFYDIKDAIQRGANLSGFLDKCFNDKRNLALGVSVLRIFMFAYLVLLMAVFDPKRDTCEKRREFIKEKMNGDAKTRDANQPALVLCLLWHDLIFKEPTKKMIQQDTLSLGSGMSAEFQTMIEINELVFKDVGKLSYQGWFETKYTDMIYKSPLKRMKFIKPDVEKDSRDISRLVFWLQLSSCYKHTDTVVAAGGNFDVFGFVEPCIIKEKNYTGVSVFSSDSVLLKEGLRGRLSKIDERRFLRATILKDRQRLLNLVGRFKAKSIMKDMFDLHPEKMGTPKKDQLNQNLIDKHAAAYLSHIDRVLDTRAQFLFSSKTVAIPGTTIENLNSELKKNLLSEPGIGNLLSHFAASLAGKDRSGMVLGDMITFFLLENILPSEIHAAVFYPDSRGFTKEAKNKIIETLKKKVAEENNPARKRFYGLCQGIFDKRLDTHFGMVQLLERHLPLCVDQLVTPTDKAVVGEKKPVIVSAGTAKKLVNRYLTGGFGDLSIPLADDPSILEELGVTKKGCMKGVHELLYYLKTNFEWHKRAWMEAVTDKGVADVIIPFSLKANRTKLKKLDVHLLEVMIWKLKNTDVGDKISLLFPEINSDPELSTRGMKRKREEEENQREEEKKNHGLEINLGAVDKIADVSLSKEADIMMTPKHPEYEKKMKDPHVFQSTMFANQAHKKMQKEITFHQTLQEIYTQVREETNGSTKGTEKAALAKRASGTIEKIVSRMEELAGLKKLSTKQNPMTPEIRKCIANIGNLRTVSQDSLINLIKNNAGVYLGLPDYATIPKENLEPFIKYVMGKMINDHMATKRKEEAKKAQAVVPPEVKKEEMKTPIEVKEEKPVILKQKDLERAAKAKLDGFFDDMIAYTRHLYVLLKVLDNLNQIDLSSFNVDDQVEGDPVLENIIAIELGMRTDKERETESVLETQEEWAEENNEREMYKVTTMVDSHRNKSKNREELKKRMRLHEEDNLLVTRFVACIFKLVNFHSEVINQDSCKIFMKHYDLLVPYLQGDPHLGFTLKLPYNMRGRSVAYNTFLIMARKAEAMSVK